MPSYPDIAEILLKNYSGYIIKHQYIQSSSGRIQKLRFELINNALVDIYYSKSSGNYSFHYETETEYYRHDNSPHHPNINSFPKHSHYKDSVEESNLSKDILQAARFL
ncbi:MAG: DUF6516 family protein [Ignavibacteria bacterium]|nr:DUF6516 family protein [Ignavibacteria bacterium]